MTRTRLRQRLLGALIPTTVALSVGLALATTAQAASPTSRVVTARHSAPAFRTVVPGDASWRIPVVKRILHVPSRSTVYGHRLRHRVVHFKQDHRLAATPLIGERAWHALKHWQGVERIVVKRHAIIRVARAHVGDPYVYGAAGPHAFDCSGFVQFVYRQATGRTLPRVGSAQFAAARPESRHAARPGDIVAFYSGGYIYHVAIYAGHGMIYHAPHTGTVVHRAPIFSGNVRFGRLLPRS